MRSIKQELTLLAALLLVVLVVYAWFLVAGTPTQNPQPTQQNISSGMFPTPTPPSSQVLQQLSKSTGFQYLVSYTGHGFQPTVLEVKKGQTVRFINNSTQELWVASVGNGNDQNYPGSSDCGGSAFDSCQTLKPGDFWEFTFTQSGTWEFQNNLDKSQSGMITVTVQ